MLYILKNFKWTIFISIVCIILGVLTFLTFINVGFIPLTDQNLQILLISAMNDAAKMVEDNKKSQAMGMMGGMNPFAQ